MRPLLRERDPGLQPERTAMSWHRTVFSALALSVLIVRTGFCRGDLLMGTSGVMATLLSLMIMVVSARRQKLLAYGTALVSISSVTAKRLICVVLFLNALALMAHSVVAVLRDS